MRKIWILLFVFITMACANNIKEQKFVNPLFYKVMNPLSTGSWYTQITPTEMLSSNKGTDLIQKCTLIENTMEAVTLQCEGAYKPENVLQYRFVPDLNIKRYSGILVRMTFKKPGIDNYPATESFIIHNSD